MVDELDEPPQEVPPLATPSSSQHATPSPMRNSPSSRESSSNRSFIHQGPMKMRSIRDVLEQIKDEETNLFCLYVDYEHSPSKKP